MKQVLKSLFRYFMLWLKIAIFAPVVVSAHLFRVVHGLYLLAAHTLLGMKHDADSLLDGLLNIDL